MLTSRRGIGRRLPDATDDRGMVARSDKKLACAGYTSTVLQRKWQDKETNGSVDRRRSNSVAKVAIHVSAYLPPATVITLAAAVCSGFDV